MLLVKAVQSVKECIGHGKMQSLMLLPSCYVVRAGIPSLHSQLGSAATSTRLQGNMHTPCMARPPLCKYRLTPAQAIA